MWVLVSAGLSLPVQHVDESWQSAEFFANKVASLCMLIVMCMTYLTRQNLPLLMLLITVIVLTGTDVSQSAVQPAPCTFGNHLL